MSTVVIGIVDFFFTFIYTRMEIGGVLVNEFEQNVQSKRNDAIDSAIGFVVSFVFFTAIFAIGVIIEFIGR